MHTSHQGYIRRAGGRVTENVSSEILNRKMSLGFILNADQEEMLTGLVGACFTAIKDSILRKPEHPKLGTTTTSTDSSPDAMRSSFSPTPTALYSTATLGGLRDTLLFIKYFQG